jgi:mono/diheme cytochrome c family protein
LRRDRLALVSAALAIGLAASGRAETPLERGAYLMNSIVACGNCHTPQSPSGPVPGRELAGGLVIEEPDFTARVPNITPDLETGIGRWSDAEIIAAIRDGKRPDGSLIGPPMPIPLYRGIADTDAAALVAYIRSVPPVRNAVERSTFRIPLPPSYGPPAGAVADLPRTDALRYGAYLAGPLGHCLECHTPMLDGGMRDFATRPGAGGPPINGPLGAVVPPNITPDRQTGIGDWTDAQIKAAITQGVSKDGRKLVPPMAFGYYARMTSADLDALVIYLRSLRPVRSH